MNYKEISKAVANKLNIDELTEILRGGIDDISMLINVLSVSQELLYCQSVVDFSVVGYKIVRNKDITDITTCDKNDSLAFLNMIYNKEGLFPKQNMMIDIKSWNSTITALITKKIPVTVECAFDDAIDYYVGWIKSLSNNIATMQCFDGSGVMFKDEVKVNINFISQITFGDDYTCLMSKYARNK